MFKINTIIGIFILVTSCSKERLTEIIVYEKTNIEIIFPYNEYNNIDLLDPINIKNVNNEYLIVVDIDPAAFLKVFKIPEMQYLYSWGRQGRGPEEVSDIFMMDFQVVGDAIMVIDAALGKADKYVVTDTEFIKKSTHTIRYEGMAGPLNSITYVRDSVFIVENDHFEENYKKYLVIRLDESDTLNSIGDYPKEVRSGNSKKSEFGSRLIVDTYSDYIYEFYNRRNFIDKYDISGKQLATYKVIDELGQDYKNNEILYTGSIASSGDYIYVFSNIMPDSIASSTILDIWNSDLNQIKRYDLGKQVILFDASSLHESIYVLNLDSDPSIIVYKITTG